MSMPPEITTKVVANNTLQTQCVKIGQVTNYFRGYQEERSSRNSANYETISIDYFDPVKLDFIPGEYYNFGYYNFEETQDPTEQTNFSWIHYSGDGAYRAAVNIGQISLGQGYDDLRNGLFIMDGSSTTPSINYFYHDLSGEDLEKIRKTKNGYADFEIGLCPDAYNRPANYKFTEPTAIIKNYFTNGRFAIHNYIAVGAYSDDQTERFRFVLSFIMLWNSDRSDYVVYFRPNIVDGRPGNGAILVPNWNGLTFKKFKFVYRQSATSNQVLGTLYYYDENDQLVKMAENITPSDRDATKPYSTQFGSYSSAPGQGNMVIKNLNYNAYVTDSYRIAINDDLSHTYTFDEIVEYFKERYKFKVHSNEAGAYINIIWSWMNKQSRVLNGQQEYITFEDSFFDQENVNSLTYLQNPRKNIKIYSNCIDSAGNGYIDELILDESVENQPDDFSGLVSNINTADAPSLRRLILKNNRITSLDLSNNNKLSVLVCHNLINSLKLPKITGDMIIDLYDNAYSPSIFNLEGKNKVKIFLSLNYTNVHKTETLILKNISIVSDLSDFTEDEARDLKLENMSKYITIPEKPIYELYWPKLKLVDISYSNIISNRKTLETFLNKLPDRTGQENGLIFMYGPKFTVNGIKGDLSTIDTTLENLRKKNWLFYA